MTEERCAGCGIALAPFDGPTHRYIESSPACWALYGELLAREFSDPLYFTAHRLSVDTYAVQHPGRESRQSTQSVAVHLMSLYAVLEGGLSPSAVTPLLDGFVKAGGYAWLTPPAFRGRLTVAHVLGARDAVEHGRRVTEWARDAWAAWQPHHGTIARWAAPLLDRAH